MNSRVKMYIPEIGKWILVIYLLMPLTNGLDGMVSFSRVVIGEALLIIFIGKIFYDTVIWKFIHSRREAGQEIIAMIGLLISVGIILIMFLILFGFTLLFFAKESFDYPGL